MHDRIMNELRDIEQSEDVRLLYACESGSRAWGFPSRDSDYDVRFIYVQRRDWYLSINLEHKRDVIERPISEQLDLSGWDLRKALQLLRKSNPPLLEWLRSPIVYLESYGVAERLRDLIPVYYSPVASLFHYLHMARGNYRDYLQGEVVWIKKYFYVLRPLLAIKWIEAGRGVVPVEFQVLVDTMVEDAAVRAAIDRLLERKQAGEELDREPMIPAISTFITSELTRLETAKIDLRRADSGIEQLNQLFRDVITCAWE